VYLAPRWDSAGAARVDVDLRVQQLEAFLLGDQRPAYFLAVSLKQLKAFGFATLGPD